MLRWLIELMGGGDALLQQGIEELKKEPKIDPPPPAEIPSVVHYPGGSRLATPDVRHSPVIEEHAREAMKNWKRYDK
jgi:hypothetical protein